MKKEADEVALQVRTEHRVQSPCGMQFGIFQKVRISKREEYLGESRGQSQMNEAHYITSFEENEELLRFYSKKRQD